MISLDNTPLLTLKVPIDIWGLKNTILIAAISPWDRDQTGNQTC